MKNDKSIIDLAEKNKELREKLKSYSKKWEDLENIIKEEMYCEENSHEERVAILYIYDQMKNIKLRTRD